MEVVGKRKRRLLLAREKSPLHKKIGGAAFGFWFGNVVTVSVWSGAAFIFRTEAESWGLAFWGDHHITRIVAELVGVWVGGFVAGCIAKDHGSRWGLISALPRIAFWVLTVVIFTIWKGDVVSLTIGQWIVILLSIILIPFVAFHSGKSGQEQRVKNEEFFEGKRGTLIGVKWYHWFWLFFPIHLVGLQVTYGIYQIVMYLGVILRSLLWFMIVGFLMEPLLFGSLYLLALSMYKTYTLLAVGSEMGFTRRQIFIRILWWTLGIYLIAGGMQTLANFVMRL